MLYYFLNQYYIEYNIFETLITVCSLISTVTRHARDNYIDRIWKHSDRIVIWFLKEQITNNSCPLLLYPRKYAHRR